MPKYSITVIRTDEYEIEVDEKIWTPEEIKSWEKSFYSASDPYDIAKYLAGAIMRNGSANGFMEGFGIVKTLRPNGEVKMQFKSGLKEVKESEYSEGLLVKPITEDEDYEFEIKELTVS